MGTRISTALRIRGMLLSLYLLLSFASLHAQTETTDLSGMVKDSAGNKPLAGVSVFLNSTSKGTVTRADGSFLLKGFPKGRYELVISAIGYQTFVMEISSNHLPASLTIGLHQKATELAAFIVEPYLKNGWRLWGKFFVDNFIGTMNNSGSCTIRNKDILRFHFYKKSNLLTVTAIEPLIIENNALGYTLQFKLEEFSCDFNSNIVNYFGYPYFQEMGSKSAGRRRRWAAHRQEAYKGSVMHFIRSLYNNRCQQEWFAMQYDIKIPNIEKQRVKEIYRPEIQKADSFPMDSLHHFWEVLRQPDFFTRRVPVGADSLLTVFADNSKALFFEGKLMVSFGNPAAGYRRYSQMLLITPAMVKIEENGSYFPPQETFVSGFWGKSEKIENLLPLDYGQP